MTTIVPSVEEVSSGSPTNSVAYSSSGFAFGCSAFTVLKAIVTPVGAFGLDTALFYRLASGDVTPSGIRGLTFAKQAGTLRGTMDADSLRLPNALRRLYERRGGEARVSETAGRLVHTLAGSKPNGVILMLSGENPELAVWLLDGMDITTRLVALSENESGRDALTDGLGDDIRIAVHLQPFASFLDDIKTHRLDMVVCNTGLASAVRDQALDMVAPGGIYIELCSPTDQAGAAACLSANPAFRSMALDCGVQLLIATRRATLSKRRRRRRS